MLKLMADLDGSSAGVNYGDASFFLIECHYYSKRSNDKILLSGVSGRRRPKRSLFGGGMTLSRLFGVTTAMSVSLPKQLMRLGPGSVLGRKITSSFLGWCIKYFLMKAF